MDETKALHRATTQSRDATAGAAKRLRDDVRALLPRVASHDFGADSLGPILDSLIADGERGEFRDFAAAEQAAMAAQSVIVAFETAKALEEGQANALQARIDAVNATVDDANRYDWAALVARLGDRRRAAGGCGGGTGAWDSTPTPPTYIENRGGCA
jgi:hypothetical protein